MCLPPTIISINRWLACWSSRASHRRQRDCGGDPPGCGRLTPRKGGKRSAAARGAGCSRLAGSSCMMAMVFRSFALCLMIALLAAGTHTAAAQRVVGGSRPPEVEVDLGVLDSLGPAPTLPDLLHGQARSGRNAAAASTGSGTAQRAALQAPRHKKKPKSTAHARAQESKTVASAEARAAAPV